MIKLKSLFIPHHGNLHKPHLTRWSMLSVFGLVIIGMQLAFNIAVSGHPGVLGYATNIDTSTLNSLSNAQRTANGLPALAYNQTLANSAYQKALDMINNNYWAHVSPSGVSPWYWFGAAGYSYTSAGENLAKDFNTSSGVVNAWMASPTHRANVLGSNFTEVGYAVVNGTLQGQQTTLVVAHYATPVAITTPAASPVPAQPVPAPVVTPQVVQTPVVTQTPIPQPANETPVEETPTPVVEQKASVLEEPELKYDLLQYLKNPTSSYGVYKDQPALSWDTDSVSLDPVDLSQNSSWMDQTVSRLEANLASYNWAIRLSLLLLLPLLLIISVEFAVVYSRRHIHRSNHHHHAFLKATLVIALIVTLLHSGSGVIG
ncbi:hypothetical protein H6792_01200 [Candidatus Nomurabacteria bacterium]|nr:hypothetical protein [Candidatus Nomurabacteria bacterium]